MNRPQILIIEDDNAIGNLISTTLETQHYQYRRAKNGASGVLEAASCRPDVILLDLGLPDMDGVDIIKKVRTWSNTPIIVISARSEDHDKVEALDAGADDYLTKPFSVEELLARLRVSLRRVRYDSEKVDEAASIYQNGGLKIDYAAGCTYQNGKEIHLTPIEYKLLCLLAKNVGKVLTHNFILKEVWGSALPGIRLRCVCSWLRCAKRSSRCRHSQNTSRPMWAWVTGCCALQRESPYRKTDDI